MRMRLIAACAACAVGGAGAAYALASDGGSAAGRTSATSPKVLFAVLTGRKEVDAQGRRGAGDPQGRGTFSGQIAGDQLCFGITVRGIDDPIAAHVHRGGPRTAGPVVIPLTHPTSGDPGTSSGCTDVTEDQARALLRNPHRFYVNVHTEPFPGGAVRGQLFGKRR